MQLFFLFFYLSYFYSNVELFREKRQITQHCKLLIGNRFYF